MDQFNFIYKVYVPSQILFYVLFSLISLHQSSAHTGRHWLGITTSQIIHTCTCIQATETELRIYWINSTKCMQNPTTTLNILGRRLYMFFHFFKNEMFFDYSCSCSSIHYPFIISFRVHIKLSERVSISSGRDSGLKSMEVLGMMTLKINEGGYGKINLSIANNEDRTVQFQVVYSDQIRAATSVFI